MPPAPRRPRDRAPPGSRPPPTSASFANPFRVASRPRTPATFRAVAHVRPDQRPFAPPGERAPADRAGLLRQVRLPAHSRHLRAPGRAGVGPGVSPWPAAPTAAAGRCAGCRGGPGSSSASAAKPWWRRTAQTLSRALRAASTWSTSGSGVVAAEAAAGFGLLQRGQEPGGVQPAERDPDELRAPAADEAAVRVVVLALLDRVVDADRVDPGGAGLHLRLRPVDAGLVVGEQAGEVQARRGASPARAGRRRRSSPSRACGS